MWATSPSGARTRVLPVLQPRPSGAVDSASSSKCQETRARRRPLHRSRKKMTEIVTKASRYHRRGHGRPSPILWLRRRSKGPLRRHPRLHRLQCLHFALGNRRAADDLHENATRARSTGAAGIRKIPGSAAPTTPSWWSGPALRRECARCDERGYTCILMTRPPRSAVI